MCTLQDTVLGGHSDIPFNPYQPCKGGTVTSDFIDKESEAQRG